MKNESPEIPKFSAQLLQKIKTLDDVIWKTNIDKGRIENWVKRIIGEEGNFEFLRTQLLYLLSHFIFLGIKEIRELLKTLYRDLIEYKIIEELRADEDDFVCDQIAKDLAHELSLTRFVSLGNPSESGSLILYFFRQATKLDKSLFINQNEIFTIGQFGNDEIKDKRIKRYIFLDDFCGGGTQASRYSKDTLSKVKSIDSSPELVYISLFGTKQGLDYMRKRSLFTRVDSYYHLDESYKAFSENSRIYNNSIDIISKSDCERIVTKIGEELNPGEPLGKNNGQYLLSFFYNTPNNSLPIFWKSNELVDYEPIFFRYEKNYGGSFS